MRIRGLRPSAELRIGYGAGLKLAIERGLLWKHDSTYVKFARRALGVCHFSCNLMAFCYVSSGN
jgi:hypothetical protein